MEDEALRELPVAVLGLGIEGLDLGRFLLARGARVTAFDTRPREAVVAAAAALESLGATVRLGPLPVEAADAFAALYVSQSILLHRDPFVARMRMLGRPIRSMISEFLRRWPGPVAGISGSSGKTTTTSLVAAGFATAGVPHIVGGNIGAPLLGQLDSARPDRWAVLEISHTQLQLTGHSPHLAAVTNVTPNHLDQFSWNEYVDLKRSLIRYQTAEDIAVLNATSPAAAALAMDTRARAVWFNADVSEHDSFFVAGTGRGAADLVARSGTANTAFMRTGEIPLRGVHNVENVLAAAAICVSAGIPIEAFGEAVRQFTPVPHRLEFVASLGGAAYYNDSIATSPERTLAGIHAFGEPLVLLLGGREKRLPLDELAAAVHERARAVFCFGEAGALLAAAIEGCTSPGRRATVHSVPTMPDAVEAAVAVAQTGDIVLLSPACTSFDAYPNFERRGEEFRRIVLARAAQAEQKEGASSQR